MNSLDVLLTALLLPVLALSAYVDRIYSEMGKFLARNYQDNIDSWVERVEPRMRLGRESLAQSASMLRQLSLAAVAVLSGIPLGPKLAVLHARGQGFTSTAAWMDVARTLFELVLLILIFDRLIPQLLFTQTRGIWVRRLRYLLQVIFFIILPITLLLGLLLSIAALAEPEEPEEDEHPSEAVDALLEAGEEEGILELSDRELVRSALEFGDKLVREVMTPRPEIFAVPATLTLTEFTAEIAVHVFSRVPVYQESLDQVTGIAFAHDLLQVTDTDALTRTVAEIERPAAFVPETKNIAELLREMQSEKQHMRIVIDEYGAVAGVVTIEDLLEAIVGEIDDEHDEHEPDEEPLRDGDGGFVVSGSFELSRLRELFTPMALVDQKPTVEPEPWLTEEEAEFEPEEREREPEPPVFRLPEHYESTTVGGLVSEIAGHIPLPGEVVEEDGLRMEVLASTDRRIDRIRVSFAPEPEQ